MKRILVAALVAGSLAGCATQNSGQQFNACLENVKNDAALAPLARKLGVNGISGQSMEVMSNKEYASDADRPLISRWSAERERCFANADASWRKDFPPQLYALTLKANSQVKQLTLRLYSGAITYGEFAQGRQIVQDLFNQDKVQLDAAMVDKAAAERRQVLLMQLQSQLNKPAPAPMPAPYMVPMPAPASSTTNCTTIGNQVNCVSR